MTLLVAFAPGERGKAALHLAGMLARSDGNDLVVCAVIPSPWPPGPARVDAEFLAYLDSTAQEALETARASLPGDVPATFIVHKARSAPAGLLEVAEERDVSMIVLGSSSGGVFGHIALGSVSDRLLHSSPVPLALTTRGFRCQGTTRVDRVTAAFDGSAGGDDLVVAAAGVAARVGATLRIASFAVRPPTIISAGVGTRAEEGILAQWAKSVRGAQAAASELVRDLPRVPDVVETVLGQGHSWDQALEDVEWASGDVLAIGSSTIGPVARVFLGSRAAKIVRHSPVPVVVVPRGAVTELVEQAESA